MTGTRATTRPELGELKPGQQVMVRRARDRRRAPEGNYIPAVVVKVARVWVELERADGSDYPQTWRMRRDTQDEGTQWSGSDASFATLEQHAWDKTRTWAFGVLADHGIWIDPQSCWHGREVELADLLSREDAS